MVSCQLFVICRMAKNQQYDSNSLIDIFKQYGDHLYNKGNYNQAVEQYIKTVGKLEPSYVIRKVRTYIRYDVPKSSYSPYTQC